MPTESLAFGDEDWPCQNRKVVHLSWGQMWAGPPLPESSRAWRDDDELDAATARLAARRTSMEEARGIVEGIAAAGDRSRDERLIALFAGSFARIDRQRAEIVEGIERLARRERARSERIDAMRAELARLETDAKPDDFDTLDRIDELADEIEWDTRIYEDRRRSIGYVCETPVILEKRAFELARLIQGALSE